MCMGGGGGDGGAGEAKRREAQRQARISEGTQNINTQFSRFDDPYFAGREKAYVDYAQPQLDTQYADARKQLVYALSRSGLLSSSTAADRQRKLQEEKARYDMDVVNRAKGYSTQARSDLENARGDLISQLTATEDPAAANAAAVQRADLMSRPPSFDPVGNFVFNAAEGLRNYANPSTGYGGLVGNKILFNSSPGGSSESVRYN